MNGETLYDELDRYALDRMGAEERTAFEKRIASDDGLREELEWLAAATLAMNSSGKTILRKQLAQIVASVPDAALEQYTPSINKKGFLKKWWWLIAGIVAVAAAVAGWWILSHLHDESWPARIFNSGANMPQEEMIMPPAKTQMDSLQPGASPPAAQEKPPGASAAEAHADPPPQSKFKNTVTDRVSTIKDTNRIVRTESYSIRSVAFSDQPNRRIEVRFYPQKGKTPTYLFTGKLMLYSSYENGVGLHFYGNENEVTMTDDKGGYYLLKKGTGEQPLVKMKSMSK